MIVQRSSWSLRYNSAESFRELRVHSSNSPSVLKYAFSFLYLSSASADSFVRNKSPLFLRAMVLALPNILFCIQPFPVMNQHSSPVCKSHTSCGWILPQFLESSTGSNALIFSIISLQTFANEESCIVCTFSIFFMVYPAGAGSLVAKKAHHQD